MTQLDIAGSDARTQLSELFSADHPVTVAPSTAASTTTWQRLLTAGAARLLLTSVLGLLFWSVAPAALGWETTTVMTGSMEPRITPGDVVVARPVDPVVLMPEQVLLVADPDHVGRLRLHRLVAVEADGRLQLKGDANAQADSTPVARDAVRGVAVLRVPFIGSPVVWLAEGDWTALALTVVGAVALIHLAGVDGPRRGAPAAAPGASRGWSSRRPVAGAALLVLVVVTVLVARPSGAGWAASTVNPTSSAASAAFFSCASAFAATTPTQSYRLDETAGPTAADSSGNNRPATYQGGAGVGYGAIGPCPRDPGTAITLDGAAGYVSTGNLVANPTTYSTEIWFRTTTTRGGLLTGFGTSATGSSANYDRMVYMQNNGTLTFGTYTLLSYNTLTSPAAYNDGLWHHVAATQSAAGMRLYVDGAQVAANGVIGAQLMNGYWRIGYQPIALWPSSPTSSYFQGTVANAVFSSTTALTAAQVADHFAAAAPYTSCREAVQAAGPLEFYRLGEPAGALAQDYSGADRAGTYQGAVTRGVTGPCGPTRGVTLDGSTGYLSTSALFTAPTTYTVEAWFRTSGTRGGLIGGFSGSATGPASLYDRMVYLTDTGQLIFGTFPNGFQVVRSAAGLNDGLWHHVAATQSAAGMRLYVDGAVVGSNPNTAAQVYDGYWRFGFNNLATWESAPASPYFAGSLINAAVYPTALTATQVAAHWSARTAAGNGPG